MAGVVVAAGTGEVAVATVTATIQSSEGCRSARTAFVRAADNAVVECRSERNQDAEPSSLVDHPSNCVSDKTSTSTSRCKDSSSSPETRTRFEEDRTDHTQLVRVCVGGKPTSLSGGDPDCKSTSSESPAQQHDEEEASRSSRSTELLQILPEAPDLVENGSEASSVGSTTSTTTSPSTLSLPLPPVVPIDMAEAIKRQKGTGNVRYWKTKHLQSGRNQAVPLNKSGTVGGFRSAMFPVLKPPSLHGSGSGSNGNAAAPGATLRMTKAKERLIRQRGKENALGDLRRSIHNKVNNNNNSGQAPVYHTQYMYGHGLGEYPPPPAAYRRSVDALENLLSLPLPPSLPHPAPLRLTPSSSLNLTDPTTRPNPTLTLTQLSPQESAREGPPPLDAPDDLSLQDDPDLQGRALGRLVERGQGDLAGMTDLTCLQLADAILGTRTTDLSQYYQICQTKIRYVDFLERSATFRALEPSPHPTTKPPNSKPQPSPHLHPSTPRLHTWVPGLDLKDTHLPDDVTASGGDASPGHNDGDSSTTDSARKEKKTPYSPVTLPSLVAPASGAGMKMTHGLPPSAGTKSFLSFCNDTELGSKASPRSSSVFPTSSSTGLHLPASSFAAVPSGKPILKPFNPDAISVKIQRPFDPFSPRSVYSDLTGTPCPAPLSVRGTTMYPMSTAEGGRAEISGEVGADSRRSQSSKSRKEAELRKRAVRFSISDQVYEFAPGEPLVP